MAIRVPGYRTHFGRRSVGSSNRGVVAALSLTAMVDMFTVLTVFLLQNYNPDTGAVLDIPAEVNLPQASKHEEVLPSHVITITHEYITFDKEKVISLQQVAEQEDLLLVNLRDRLERAIQAKFREQTEGLSNQLKTALDQAKSRPKKDSNAYRKVTIQADRDIEFRIIKKVMHSASEAGASEINFAVMVRDTPGS